MVCSSEHLCPSCVHRYDDGAPGCGSTFESATERLITAQRRTHSAFVEALQELSAEMAESAASKGFVTGWENVPEKIALIHSELSEALEAHRNGNPPDSHVPQYSGVVVEFADACIRIMSLCAALKLPLAEAIIAKMEYNKSRPHKHGGKKY